MSELLTGTWPLGIALVVLGAGAAVTLVAGIRLSTVADTLADRTGWGEALFGAVVFGGITSLSGIVMTATAAVAGHPAMAYSNAVGGIAAQTAAVAVADLFYRGVNLEHAAASAENLVSGALLTLLMALAVLGALSPDWTLAGIHPTSVLLVAAYAFGLRTVREVRRHPPWRAVQTPETRQDEPEEARAAGSDRRLFAELAGLGTLVAVAGWSIARAAETLLVQTGWSESLVGGLVMGVANAIPETVTAVAAVRRGALTLAVGVVLGGNAFDVLNLAIGDVAFRGGSLYHAADTDALFLTVAATAMTAVLVLGMLRREVHGLANVGTEGVVTLLLWLSAMVVLAF